MPPINLQDLTGLAKPLEKLIDVVSGGIGKTCNPLLVLAGAKVDAIKIKQISQAITEANENGNNQLAIEYNDGPLKVSQQALPVEALFTKEEVADRIQSRTAHQEIKKQLNIEKVVVNAALELASDVEVNNVSVESDWIDRFFDKSQHISNETMQKIWGKVLAGETANPGTYSLRTLDVLSNMTIVEAGVFRKIARYNIGGVVFKNAFGEKLTYIELITLRELGLLSPENALQVTFSISSSQSKHFVYFDKILVISSQTENKLSFGVEKFTRVGLDLLNLADIEPDMDYFKLVVQNFKALGADGFVADIINKLPGQIQYHNQIPL